MNIPKNDITPPMHMLPMPGWYMIPLCLDEEEKMLQNAPNDSDVNKDKKEAVVACNQPILKVFTKVELYEQDFYQPESAGVSLNVSRFTADEPGQNVNPGKGIGNLIFKQLSQLFSRHKAT
jgi:hypothetical protein